MAVLATFYCYDHGAKAKRVSQMLLACCNLLNSQITPINQEQWKKVGW